MKLRNNENTTFSVSRVKNDYNTPLEAWELLMDNMRNTDVTFWLPFYNDGSIKQILQKKFKLKVIHKDKDFYKYEPKSYDVIADNPPFSNKWDVFKRCKHLGKPFAILVPMETMERKYFNDLFKDDESLQVIVPKKRYEFTNSYENSSNKIPFKSVWVTYNMDLKSKNNIIFE